MASNWKKLVDTNGRAQFVNIDHVAYVTEDVGCSWVHFSGRGGPNSIGAIAVTAKPSEILDGEAVS
ncbi:hypothetical protein ACVIGB_006487 [Bradyrhizobium sp. USDA 4341]